MVIGQVVGIHIDENILRDGMIDMSLAAPLSRLGYLDYAVTDAVFQMRRPRRRTPATSEPRRMVNAGFADMVNET